MTAAIFGLLGVLVGGVLNLAVALAADRRQLRRQARVAARLVSEELLIVLTACNVSLEHGRWRGLRAIPPPLTVWREQRASLAAALPFEDWQETLVTTRVCTIILQKGAEQERDDPLTDHDREMIGRAVVKLDEALSRLDAAS